MKHRYLSNHTALLSLIVPLALAVSLSGCVLFGLGAAAGAAVGGCSLLDQNEDDQVTEAELTAALFDDWDANNSGSLSESEFDAGIEGGDMYAGWDGNFDNWDDDSDDNLTESEFRMGVSEDADTEAWLDSECDDLGL